MAAFKRGQVVAFEVLVKRHRTAVFHFILRSTGQPARAEDLLQETWLRVIRGASDYAPRAKFTTWVYTIARNLCLDSARRERHRETDSLDAAGRGGGLPLGMRLPDESRSPESAAHELHLRPLLERALASLSEEQREVFVLREYSGMGFREIGEVTGVSENTVKSRMRYALDALRRRLGELGVDGNAPAAKTVSG